EICNWLNKQAIFQVHKPPPRYIPRVSFNTIQIPNECHQADILYMPYNKIRKITYMFCLNVVDIASRYKASVPIGGIISNIDAFKKIYNDSTCPLTYLKLLLTDKGSVFRKDCERLMIKHCIKIQKANSKLRYLLEPGELEGGKHRVTDYENSNGPERSFVHEQLIKVDKIEYSSKWVLQN
ncbi:6905_t:CDS:2, partial [Cetraspora pellucida]